MIGEAPESQTEPADRRSDWMADALLAPSALARVGRALRADKAGDHLNARSPRSLCMNLLSASATFAGEDDGVDPCIGREVGLQAGYRMDRVKA